MTPQEIKQGMTQGEWVVSTANSVLTKDTRDVVCRSGLTDIHIKTTDALAVTTAVNNTYGKGYNPEAMEECVKMLELISENYFSEISPFTIKNIEEIITKSKI